MIWVIGWLCGNRFRIDSSMVDHLLKLLLKSIHLRVTILVQRLKISRILTRVKKRILVLTYGLILSIIMLFVFLFLGDIPIWFSISEEDGLLLHLSWFLQGLVHWWLDWCWCLGWHFSRALKSLKQMTVDCLLRLMTAFVMLPNFLRWNFKFSF